MSTLSYPVNRARETPLETRAHVFLILEGARPLEGSARYRLTGDAPLSFGRGAARSARRIGASAQGAPGQAQEELRVEVPDARMSSRHARVARRGDGWSLEDLGSKNGTFVNGERRGAGAGALSDGDTFRLGDTVFRFRDRLPAEISGPETFEGAGAVPAFATLLPSLARELDALARAAAQDVPVLLLGETGTGKEVLANALHALSRRRGAMTAVNCGALPQTLVEGELFGYRKGAFSGATVDHPGLVRSSHGGTLFLDEIGDLPLAAQAALLRVLQEREVLPIGATQPVKVDLRVVAATHRDLATRVATGAFREDLYARLSGFVFRLAPLRERREDLGLLVASILRARGAAPGGAASTGAPSIAAEVVEKMLAYAWPRNVRELEKCLARALAVSDHGAVELHHLPAEIRDAGAPGDAASRSLAPREGRAGDPPMTRGRFVEILHRLHGSVSDVARELATSRSQVHRLARRLGVDLEDFRR